MIRLEPQGDALVLRLTKGKGNGLEPELLGELTRGLEEAHRADPRGLILTGEGAMFCAGLDLVRLAGFDRAGMQEVLDGLFNVLFGLFTAPRPVVAALSGHAIAGGALLALGCDRRFLVPGRARFGLTEIALGVPMPASTVPVLQYALLRPALETLVYGGALHDPETALAMGAVDALVPEEELLPRSVTAIEEWTAHRGVFADVKRRLHAPHVEAMHAARADDPVWLDAWFSDVAQARIAEMREKLTRPKGGA